MGRLKTLICSQVYDRECRRSYKHTVSDPEKNHTEILFATVTAVNSVGLNISAYSGPIRVDDTPPQSGVVVELSSASRIDPKNDTATVEMNRRACQTRECKLFIMVQSIKRESVHIFTSLMYGG